ncbi:MAG: efflux RND transporter permease subunit [Alphaproteobacteria bacterium]|nr:efflux RND transporter permease subunit [Alphaproteobacteria bacterium]
MSSLIDAALSRSRTVLALLVFLLIAGGYAYQNIPKESSPDIDIPVLYISMALEGISPDDAERLLLRPMEQELSTIEGVKKMKSTGYTGGGFVILEFQAGFDKDKAVDDVQKAVDLAKTELPDSMDSDPKVTEVNFSLFPVLVVTLSGQVPERSLVKIAKNLQEEIEGISTVLEATIAGNREEQVEIIVDPALLESYGLRGDEILQFFNRSNRLVAAGDLDTGVGRFPIKVPGLFEDVNDVLDMPLKTVGDSTIRVRDIAEIRQTFKDPETFARINGKRAVALNIVKRTGESIIETIEAVKQVVETQGAYWPEGVEIIYTLDESGTIRERLKDLQNNIISAILLVMIVLIAVMGFRAAGLVGVAIPTSFLSGVLILYAMGLTVNIVVLFALILSVGMLVDGAIVVTEFADRKLAEGLSKKEAYGQAAKRMAWPITASTATTLAAFAPLLFWPDIVGEFMQYMPITLIAVLGSSLVTALVFMPVLGSVLGRQNFSQKGPTKPPLQKTKDLQHIKGPVKIYLKILQAVLRVPGLILLTTVILLIGIQFTYGKFGKGVEFFPDIEPEAASILIHARGNLSVYEQDILVREVEKRILDKEGIAVFYTQAGKQDQQGNDDIAADVIGRITLEFKDWFERDSSADILQDIRARTSDIAGIRVETQEQEDGPPGGKDVQIEIRSFFPQLIEPTVEQLLFFLESDSAFIDIEDSRPLPGIEWEMEIDRAQASKFNIDVSLLGDYVRMVTNGLKVTDYRPDGSDDEVDIVIRYPKDQRTLDNLDNIRIETSGGSVPISNFIKRVPKPAIGTLNRVAQQRVITIKANLKPGTNINAKVKELRAWMAENADKLDPRVNIEFVGEDEDQREAQAFLMKAFIIALFVMAVILVTQFNSFYSAFLILFSVVMSTIGVMIGLLITGQPFGIVMSGIGVIALAGIVVNNNIVLIDTYDQHRLRGLSIYDSILITGVQRLRPVLLTTVTTILGLLPMVLQLNIDFIAREVSHGAPSTQWWVQLSTAIVFGLGFSTILTLLVTPCALMMRKRAVQMISFLKSLFGKEKTVSDQQI